MKNEKCLMCFEKRSRKKKKCYKCADPLPYVSILPGATFFCLLLRVVAYFPYLIHNYNGDVTCS